MVTMQITDECFKMFLSESGAAFVTHKYWLSPMYYRKDVTQPFYEVMCDGGNGSRVSFHHPHHGENERGYFVHHVTGGYDPESFEMDGVTYWEQPSPSEIEVVPYPIKREPRYLFRRVSDGQYIYVSAVENSYSHQYFLNSHRLYIGDGRTMRQVRITKVDHYLDGGTTIIQTTEAVLTKLSGLRPKGPTAPTWNPFKGEKEELIKLNPSQFRIIETEESVQIAE